MSEHNSVSVSVIVPVYNAERYIAACLDSLLKQTLQTCEFIVVDDGSTDISRRIIEDFQQGDHRIKLIAQSNQGVSAARNAGLAVAKGEYVGFVDADDYIEADMYERMYKAAKENDCDVVLTNFESELEGHIVLTAYSFPMNQYLDRSYITHEVLPFFLKSDTMNTSVNKVYRRELLQKYSIQFPYRVALGEDGLFNMHVFGYASSMVYINYSGYHYREVLGSATRNVNSKDYFGRAMEVYMTDPPPIYSEIIPVDQIKELKAVRLMKSTLSNIYIYLKASDEMSFLQRYDYVKRMISNEHVQQALPIYRNEMSQSINRYDKYMLACIRARSIVGLICAVAYSRYRNQK